MIRAACHCGAVRIELARKPRTLTACNCSICRRYGTLWVYYQRNDVRIRSGRGSTSAYAWGDRSIRFVRCRRCGCIMHWEPVRKAAARRIGVNARNLEPAVLSGIRVRRLDGAGSWKYLD